MNNHLIALCWILLTNVGAAERDADHVALRALLATMTGALNSSNFATFSDHLAPGFHITFADQRTFTSIDELAAYKQEMATKQGITSVIFVPEIDGPTIFLNDTTGICTGRSTDTFTSSSGVISMTSRWTATVIRDQGAAWKVAAFHSGVNLLDNPVLDRTRSTMVHLVWIIGIAGVLAGLIAGWLLGRRRTRA